MPTVYWRKRLVNSDASESAFAVDRAFNRITRALDSFRPDRILSAATSADVTSDMCAGVIRFVKTSR